MTKSLPEWETVMGAVFREVAPHPSGRMGGVRGRRVRNGRIKLDEIVAPLGEAAVCAVRASLSIASSSIKTANIWGVKTTLKARIPTGLWCSINNTLAMHPKMM
ncbi:MAG: hypothetical protein R3C26_19880 [Calditrichia bacterium]